MYVRRGNVASVVWKIREESKGIVTYKLLVEIDDLMIDFIIKTFPIEEDPYIEWGDPILL
ncbi:hypothetical protein [Clostridium botulinum]|uniref:hypothetical protein n=1 Tax=Clostridium botulinum TaxID=1491 RepID=UPI00095797BD|nr:hypothetical protein [Clostridium botulinum]APU60218.1 hypothetical protein NPD8_2177 [Clostridium botulinum]